MQKQKWALIFENDKHSPIFNQRLQKNMIETCIISVSDHSAVAKAYQHNQFIFRKVHLI